MYLQNIRIVLVEPSHPGNIGAVARSLKTMGLNKLVLVNPRKFPHAEASARAAGADDILEAAEVVSDVRDAIADCTFVLGTSVRDREISWPTSNPRQAAESICQHIANGDNSINAQSVAILFGRENSGLSNDELELCQHQISIPANQDYSSLNLASAVQIITYELRMSVLAQDADAKTIKKDENKLKLSALQKRQQPANHAQIKGHLEHLEKTMEELDFIKSGPSTMLMRKLTRLYNKAELTVEEIQILRGILSAMQDHLLQLKKQR